MSQNTKHRIGTQGSTVDFFYLHSLCLISWREIREARTISLPFESATTGIFAMYMDDRVVPGSTFRPNAEPGKIFSRLLDELAEVNLRRQESPMDGRLNAIELKVEHLWNRPGPGFLDAHAGFRKLQSLRDGLNCLKTERAQTEQFDRKLAADGNMLKRPHLGLAGAVIVYRQTHSNAENTCTNEHGLETYLLISVLTLMLEVGVELAIAWISLQGTVSDDRPRRHMDKAIYVHSTLILLELSAQIFGLSLLWGSNPVTCPNAKGTGLIVHLLIYISTAGLLLYTFLVLLLFLRSTPLNVESIDHAAIWRTRLGCVFFSHKRKQPLGDAHAGDGDVLTDVARVFAEFLEDAETVPSDILVGVILLRRKQKHHRDRVGKERRTDLDDPPCVNEPGGTEYLDVAPQIVHSRRGSDAGPLSGWETAPPSPPARQQDSRPRIGSLPNLIIPSVPLPRSPRWPSTSALPPQEEQNPQHPTSLPVTYKELAAITYFYQYAESIYGLPLYMFNNFARGAYHLCCPCTRVAPETAVAAVQVTASASSWFCCFPTTPTPSSAELADQMLPHADIIYVSLHGGLFRSPFVVCFDHPRQTVVIAVRGTLSTADVLVDLNCDLTEIQLPGGLTAQTHSGMYRTARNLLDELNTTGVLRRILLSEDSQYKSYKLLTTGHSLGGGVSSLLAFLLAQHFPSHNTRCIAYSPPGCMITASAIPHFRTFCTSVIMGLDIVPRLNRNTLESLKKDVGRCLRDCDVHKLKVLGGCFGKGMADMAAGDARDSPSPRTEDLEAQRTQRHWKQDDNEPTSSSAAWPRSVEAGYDQHHSHRSPHHVQHPKTYLPGRILYFRKSHDTSSSFSSAASIHAPSSPTTTAPLLNTVPPPQSHRHHHNKNKNNQKRRTYTPRWTAPSAFQEIIISASMARDHMPHNLRTLLDCVSEDAGHVRGDDVVGAVMC
ncbi:hypothetical protein PhCBS80983_g03174 [Powellomyces hirtus]|uniref:sn-1-specific diacylglycerol lipase n=1 Tax=Powellomyces hirtus TaxID=109895 RepID=A0A507E3P4_9FUNG|nr:hypothetical protein PhCBS80983_g03174 [Powellomyces hirtus]